MRIKFAQVKATRLLVALISFSTPLYLPAGILDEVHSVNKQRTQSAQSSQVRIDELAEQRVQLVDEYKEVSKITDGLRVYNSQLEKQINAQKIKLQELEGSIEQATILKRQITPLMLKMFSALKQFVTLDSPFHSKERNDRLRFINEALDNPSVSDAEKFRQVLEAYQIENEYGRKIDVYTDTIKLRANLVNVNVLRIGRIALIAQTKDEKTTLVWDKYEKQWIELPLSYRNPIRQGIRIARKQAARDILLLPISTPEKINRETNL